MIQIKGKGVCQGVAFGPICFLKRVQHQITRTTIEDVTAELERFYAAKSVAVGQLKVLYQKALAEVGEEHSLLFEVHQMMLEDLDYCDSIEGMIRNDHVCVEYAVAQTAQAFADMFASMDDTYMQARAADVCDISTRLQNVLAGVVEGGIDSDVPVIVAADDLAPSETVQLDKSKILAFVTRVGSANSHTAILARTMGIPAVIGAGDALEEALEGKQAVIDGETGILYVQPDETVIQTLQEKQKQEQARKQLLESLRGKENITQDGQSILLYANIGSPSDMDAVLANDAGGIGLFRSEFLYLESKDYPSEDVQFAAYRTVAERMGGHRVVIRTLDIGADKQASYFQLPQEENPAMGLRAIRICLTRQDIFITQLRALYRASAYGKIAIMFPMIISVEEVRQIKEICAQVRAQLKEEGIAFDEHVELGIMIETPAAAIISDLLAQEVDFFSIGTNDLTQYTLAIDRQNQTLDQFYNAHHPALLRLIRMTADNAHKHGIWMGICGELGADMALTETFLAMGIDELSVSPSCILPLREKVRATHIAQQKDALLQNI